MSIEINIGYIIHQDEKFIIRMKQTDNQVELFVHQRIDDKEMLPRGYVAGSNYLCFGVRQS